jgi:hypothetical protein
VVTEIATVHFLSLPEAVRVSSQMRTARSEQSRLRELKSLIRSLLQRTPNVSILIHYASDDISQEMVIRKGKRLIQFDEVADQFHKLELDVRYIITASTES